MEIFNTIFIFFTLTISFRGVILQVEAAQQALVCLAPTTSRCRGKVIWCPSQCPSTTSTDTKAKVCYLNCKSPSCKAECQHRVPNCNGLGSACYDPRFVGGDGSVFYFHGKSNEHFSLVSDRSIQINARFIGHRPPGRPRDFTWIQALGVLFNSQSFSVEAIRSATWDNETDHLKFTHDRTELALPEVPLSSWMSPGGDIKVERISRRNSVILTLKSMAEIIIKVVPVTKEDDRIHSYQIPSGNCFVHLEVQFRFFGLSPMVEGVLGRTYRPDFESPAKPGQRVPVLGGEDKYRTTSLFSADCAFCRFSPDSFFTQLETSFWRTSVL
ncbi:uncharacterized protein LOC116215975 [Punica granatum]|uniref:Uncharacterized protein LOC116215975 n=2 Tax=Punica granatum TaxID=22663 RepID=A0A6P8EN04_PUNGR|nr:uncharacterized protein LOC116215975 [Punica granatum]PKI51165.1 hypothetical protein CRG98_028452 [Punica granatum]